MGNKEISEIFDEIALMLNIEPRPNINFEIRAYQKAALTISTLQEDVREIYEKRGIAGLMDLPGIGKGMAGHIEEYLKTGKIRKYEELRKKYPIDFKNLTRIESIGAKKAFALYRELGVRNLEDLKKALQSHKIKGLDGFGEKSEEVIGIGLQRLEKSKGRILLGDALPVAESMVRQIEKSKLAQVVMIAGSARRMRETVGDIDILVLSSSPEKVMELFVKLPEVSDIVVKGTTKTTVILKIGITCDIRVIAPESLPAAIQYFTGSRDHNVQVRTISVGMGYKLNEYGLFDKKGKIIPAKTEEDIYARLGMQWMPPEMREARGEVKLAQAGKIPRVVELGDIVGDMHTHTLDTDGANTIDEMADEAMKLGRKYMATTNHTKSLQVAHGMNEEQFGKFFGKVDALNEKLEGRFKVIKGAEVDILKDGTLDMDKKFIKSLECVVCAIHTNFKMEKDEMTSRIIKALDSGLVHILAHPTGRQLLEREAYQVDIEKVFEAAERNCTTLEINAQPLRLDLNDTNIMKASEYKVSFSIGTDAHRRDQLALMRYGVGTARRGWLTQDRIINTMGLKDVMRWLGR